MSTDRRSLSRDLWLPVLVALALRLIVVAFLYPGQLNPRRDHWPFGYETGRIARAIVSGRGFSDPISVPTGPTAWTTPLYPYLVAGIFRLSGVYTKASAIFLLALNSLFSALTCVPVFFFARESLGTQVGKWAAWAWALFPYAVLVAADMIWEHCLTALLLSILFLFAIRVSRSSSFAEWMGFGALWGIAAMSNAGVLATLPGMAGWACWRVHRRAQAWFLPATLAAFAFVVVITPWFVRNYRVFHLFIPFRDVFGLVLYQGNYGDAWFWSEQSLHPSVNDAEADEFVRLGEIRYMSQKQRQASDYIAAHPALFLTRTFRRISFTWTAIWSLPKLPLAEHLDPDEPFDPANVIFCATLTLLALVGLRRIFTTGNEARWLYALTLISFPLVYYITGAHVRYRHPIDPEIVVLAVYGFAAWCRIPVAPDTLRGSGEPAPQARAID